MHHALSQHTCKASSQNPSLPTSHASPTLPSLPFLAFLYRPPLSNGLQALCKCFSLRRKYHAETFVKTRPVWPPPSLLEAAGRWAEQKGPSPAGWAPCREKQLTLKIKNNYGSNDVITFSRCKMCLPNRCQLHFFYGSRKCYL